MYRSLLDILCCPSCTGNLSVTIFEEAGGKIKSGVLRCSCGNIYPVIDFIPRVYPAAPLEHRDFFITNEQTITSSTNGDLNSIVARAKQFSPGYTQVQSMFNVQWDKFGENTKIFGKDKKGILEYIEKEMMYPGKKVEHLRAKLILDAGCGHGYYTLLFAEHGATVFGLDITNAGVEVTYKRVKEFPNAHVIQGDVMHNPFKQEQFDYIISEGVIHHTPNTRFSFHMLADRVKPGGELAIWVYPYRLKLWEITQATIRAVTTRLPAKLLYYLSYIPVPLLSVFKAYSGTSLKNASWRECAQVVWDFYSPQYQTHHSNEEILQWFLEEGFTNVAFGSDPLSSIGTKLIKE